MKAEALITFIHICRHHVLDMHIYMKRTTVMEIISVDLFKTHLVLLYLVKPFYF